MTGAMMTSVSAKSIKSEFNSSVGTLIAGGANLARILDQELREQLSRAKDVNGIDPLEQGGVSYSVPESVSAMTLRIPIIFCVVALLVTIAVGCLVWQISGFDVHKAGNVASAVAAIAALCGFLILVWYTWETQKLREAAQEQIVEARKLLRVSQEQTEMQVMPVLSLFVKQLQAVGPQEGTTRAALMLRNVGGQAFDVMVRSPEWTDVFFDCETNVIAPKERHEVRCRAEKQPTFIDDFLSVIKQHNKRDSLRLTINCKSVSSKLYTFTFVLALEGAKVKIEYAGMTGLK
jgi:uncharacterized membrane protein